MHTEKVIFAIDNNTDVHAVAKFLRHVDTLRAVNKIRPVTMCIGNWEGILEASYMMDLADYDKYISGRDWADGQECVLVVSGDTRQQCYLRFPDGTRVTLGPMVQVDAPVGNWTYVPATNKYFTCNL